MRRARLLIDGELVESGADRWIDSIEPATEDVLGQAVCASAADVAAAVEAAEQAGRSWANMSMAERAVPLRALAMDIRERAVEIAEIETRDTGNLYGPMLNDVL